MSNSMYEFRGKFYSASEISSIIQKNRDKQIKNIISYRILANILYSGGMPKLSQKIAIIADLFEDSLTGYYSTGTEKEQAKSHKRYCRKINKFGKINSLVLHNSYSYLINLIQTTLGANSVPYCAEEKLINFNALSEEECVAIANNFKRDIKGKERLPYQAASNSK